jgi:hypothetical protein
MSHDHKHRDRLEQVRAIMREWEAYEMPYDPDFARTYAGEWVVMHRGRVVAHGKDGAEVARIAPASQYPGAEIFYVPTLEEQEGVWILEAARSDA